MKIIWIFQNRIEFVFVFSKSYNEYSTGRDSYIFFKFSGKMYEIEKKTLPNIYDRKKN